MEGERPDPAERLRLRREHARRARRRRRAAGLAAVLVVLVLGAAAALLTHGSPPAGPAAAAAHVVRPAAAKPEPRVPRELPRELRGVHVTMSLASLPDKLREYLSVPGLTALELDVKDESGRVGFVSAAPALARATGAAGRYYDPEQAVALAHRYGVYLIGRVVVFEDPVVPEHRPQYAIRAAGGGIWHNRAGLSWANPYSVPYWRYVVSVATAAAKAGFDEIQFDYVRFPTDGDLAGAVFPGTRHEPMAKTIARFVKFASKRLRPLGVRVSADVFGLAATRDLGIGQRPSLIARYLDAIYPMVYPSHYRAGEYGLDDPSAAPGETVASSLRDFRRQLRGTKAKLIPWLQDFSLGRSYSIADVQAQIAAARAAQTKGYMLWNAGGVYRTEALSPF